MKTKNVRACAPTQPGQVSPAQPGTGNPGANHMTFRRSRLAAGLRRLCLLLVPILVGIAVAPAQSVAAISLTDFPSKTVVKDVLGGRGPWRAYRGDIATLGGKPRGCRSDLQMMAYDEVRARSFYGREGRHGQSPPPRRLQSCGTQTFIRPARPSSSMRLIPGAARR
jgi:hypothetical protein